MPRNRKQAESERQLELALTRGARPGDRGSMPLPRVRRSARARRLQIKVSPWKGIEVVVPMRCSQREADAFIADHEGWMEQAWQKLLLEYPEAGGWELPRSIHLPILERSWDVQLDPEASRFSARRDTLLLAGETSSAEHALRLQQWLRQQAGKALPQRMQRWIELTGLQPSGITIRGQSTRWGSCSSKGKLSLNFRLLFLAPELVDCLLLHELCHLKYMSHGKRFWGLMERYMPDVRRRDRELGAAWRDIPAWAQVTAS